MREGVRSVTRTPQSIKIARDFFFFNQSANPIMVQKIKEVSDLLPLIPCQESIKPCYMSSLIKYRYFKFPPETFGKLVHRSVLLMTSSHRETRIIMRLSVTEQQTTIGLAAFILNTCKRRSYKKADQDACSIEEIPDKTLAISSESN